MASSSAPRVLAFGASGAITRGKGVKLASASTVAQCSASTDKVIGIAQNDVSSDDATAGVKCEVALPGGGSLALAQGTIEWGDRLGVNASGALQKVAAQHEPIIAVAMQDAVASDLFAVEVIVAQATQAQA